MDPSITHNLTGLLIWDWRVAADLFFGGMGVGAFIFALLVDWRYEGKYRRICQTAAVIAPLFVVIGLIFLMLKMGRPMAILYTFASFAPSSPLWWGGIFQTLFIIGAAYYAFLWWAPDERVSLRHRLGLALLPVALVVGAYHGLLLSIFRSRALWNTGPVVVAAILGFITTGIAAIMLIHLIRMKVGGRLAQTDWVKEFLTEMREVRLILGAALLLQIFTFFIWWISLLFGTLSAQEALAAANAAYGNLFWYVGIGLGLVVPLALGAYVVRLGEKASVPLEVNMIWVTSALILIGGFIFRLVVMLGGQVMKSPPLLS